MKITGLPKFQRTALKKYLDKENHDGNFTIQFNDKISLKRMDSYWYGGNVADVIYNGYTFHIEAIGDVCASLLSNHDDRQLCYVKDKNNAGVFRCEMQQYFRTDKVLDKLLRGEHHSYYLSIENNNWWECFLTDPQGNFHDLMWVLNDDDIFSAIDEVLENFDEIINSIKGDAA